MEQGVVFSEFPTFHFKNKINGNNNSNPGKYQNNLIYEKFSLTIDNPQEYDNIYVDWDVKNQKPN